MPPSSSTAASVTRSSNRSYVNNKKSKEGDINNDADVLKKKSANGSVTKKVNKKASASNGAGKGKKKKASASSATSLESRLKKQRQADLETVKQTSENEKDEETRRRESVMKDQLIMEQHPEYAKLLAQLEASKAERMQLIEYWRANEIRNAQKTFMAQQKQAWDSYYYAKAELRASLVNGIQQRIAQLKEEKELQDRQFKALQYHNRQLLLQQQHQQQNELDYEKWVPPDRLPAIGSFVAGASYDEINRDISLASARPYSQTHQRYPHPYVTTHHRPNVNTPHLVYSDNESKSVSDSVDDEEQPMPAITTVAEPTRITPPELAPLPPISTLQTDTPTTSMPNNPTDNSSQPYQSGAVSFSNANYTSTSYSGHHDTASSPLPSIHHYTYGYDRASTSTSAAPGDQRSHYLPTSNNASNQPPVYSNLSTITTSTAPAPYSNGEPSVGWRSGERSEWYYRPRTAA